MMDAERQNDLRQTPVQEPEQLDHSRRLSQQVASQPLPQVPGYQLERPLGTGAYGVVWLAFEEKTGRQVAIKFYTHRRGLDWSLLNREVEKLALLYTSRHIVRLIDVGWQSDPPYYVMEYLEQGSLETRLTHGPLETDEAVRIIRAVCQALVHAHGRGVLHCDLKPANVLLDSSSEPRLCDFGQSRLSHEQNPALGTLFYMAPEQADLKAVPDAAWDVYALGALLYHLLTGRPPYRTPDAEERLRSCSTLEDRLAQYRQIVTTGARPKDHMQIRGVDRRLVEIVDRCLAPDPERRFANAQAVLNALEQRDRQRRNRPLVALGGIGPALILLAMFLFASNAMDSAVRTAEDNLTSRALESDVMSVRILASSVQRELQDRMDELEDVAADRTLVAAMEACRDRSWTDREPFQSHLEVVVSKLDERRKTLGRELDVSWFYADADGFQRWRYPFSADTIDQNFKHRDYFHGRNREYGDFAAGRAPEEIPPITEPHLSVAFQSQATGRNMVALSAPVRSATGQIIGVMARTTHLGQLLAQYETSIRGEAGVDRTIALVDTRDGRLLDHSHFSDPTVLARARDQFERLLLDEETATALRQSGPAGLRLTDYRDPLSLVDPEGSSGAWLAAFSPVGETGWAVIVQERKSSVLRPVDDMQSRLLRLAALAFGASGLVVGLSWYFVLKAR